MEAEHLKSEHVIFRSYLPADEAAVIRLLNMSLGDLGGLRTAEYWRWKHLRNPFGASAIRLAYNTSGEMVALRAFLRWQFKMEDRPFTAFRCVDTVVHPDYRGRGVFTDITRGLIAELLSGEPAVIFNTPNKQSLPGYLKMGWSLVGKTQLMLWPQPVQWLVNQLRGFHSLPEIRFQLPSTIQRQILTYNEVHRSQVTTNLSPEYLQWRYGQIPGIRYGVMTESGDGLATAIWRLKSTRGFKELRLVELFHDHNATTVHRLIRRLAREIRPDVVSIVVDGGGVLRSILPVGFLPAARYGLPVTVRELNDADLCQCLSDPARRNFSGGTLELF